MFCLEWKRSGEQNYLLSIFESILNHWNTFKSSYNTQNRWGVWVQGVFTTRGVMKSWSCIVTLNYKQYQRTETIFELNHSRFLTFICTPLLSKICPLWDNTIGKGKDSPRMLCSFSTDDWFWTAEGCDVTLMVYWTWLHSI